MCRKTPPFLFLPGLVLPRLHRLGPKGPLRWQQLARRCLKPHFSSFSSAFQLRKSSCCERHRGALPPPRGSRSGHRGCGCPALWARDRAVSVSLRPQSGLGTGGGGVYTNQAQRSCCCHLIPWEQSCSHAAMGNERIINLHCTFSQERAGFCSVPSYPGH